MGTKGTVILGASLLIVVLIFSSYRTPNVEVTETEWGIKDPTPKEAVENIRREK